MTGSIKAQIDNTIIVIMLVIVLVLFILFIAGLRSGSFDLLSSIRNMFGNMSSI